MAWLPGEMGFKNRLSISGRPRDPSLLLGFEGCGASDAQTGQGYFFIFRHGRVFFSFPFSNNFIAPFDLSAFLKADYLQ